MSLSHSDTSQLDPLCDTHYYTPSHRCVPPPQVCHGVLLPGAAGTQEAGAGAGRRCDRGIPGSLCVCACACWCPRVWVWARGCACVPLVIFSCVLTHLVLDPRVSDITLLPLTHTHPPSTHTAETNNKTQGGLSQVRAPNPVTFEAEVQELQQQRCRRQQQHLELQQLSAELNSVLSPDISALSLWPVDPAQLPHDPQLHARLTGHRSNPLQPQRQQQEDPAAALHESMFAEVQRGLSQRQSSSGSGDGHRVAWLEADHSHSHQGYRGPPGARRCASMGASVGRGHSASFDHNSTNTNSQQQPLRLPPSGPRGASGPLPAPSNPRTAAASNSHPLLSRSPPSHRQAQHPQPNTSSSGLLNSRRSSGVEHTGTAATQMGEGERGSCSLAFASLMDLRALGSSDANSVRTSSHSSLQLPNMLVSV